MHMHRYKMMEQVQCHNSNPMLTITFLLNANIQSTRVTKVHMRFKPGSQKVHLLSTLIQALWNFETIRGSLMKPKWQKLASLAQEICTL